MGMILSRNRGSCPSLGLSVASVLLVAEVLGEVEAVVVGAVELVLWVVLGSVLTLLLQPQAVSREVSSAMIRNKIPAFFI